jgi:hypothetical protein
MQTLKETNSFSLIDLMKMLQLTHKGYSVTYLYWNQNVNHTTQSHMHQRYTKYSSMD